MVVIPHAFYMQKTASGRNFGEIFEELISYYFEIDEETISKFRIEKPGIHTRFEHLSEAARYSTTLTGHKTAGFRTTYLSENRYQCTIVKKNTSIIKNDLLPYLSRQVVVRDLLPSFFHSFSEPAYKHHFLYQIEAALPTVKELLVRFLVAFDCGEMELEQEVVDFVDFFHLFVSNMHTPLSKAQEYYRISFKTTSSCDLNWEANRIKRKACSIFLKCGLASKEKFFSNDVVPFIKLLGDYSRQALIDNSPRAAYRNLPNYALLFYLIS
jgi:hypothetical protein